MVKPYNFSGPAFKIYNISKIAKVSSNNCIFKILVTFSGLGSKKKDFKKKRLVEGMGRGKDVRAKKMHESREGDGRGLETYAAAAEVS